MKPFLKWVGGKTQIIDTIQSKFPKIINNYHEPFLGGGSVILSLLTNTDIKINGKIYISDSNPILIELYKNIVSNLDILLIILELYIQEYDSCKYIENKELINRKPKNIEEAKSSKESYYYWMRTKFNKLAYTNKSEDTSIECSALFIILNKLCFRGVFREGPNGFNVPFGHYKTTPQIYDTDNLRNISNLLKNVIIKCQDYKDSFKNIENGDFIYIDPPYAPETNTSFVGYTKNGFSLDCHNDLFRRINQFNDSNIKFLLSNSNVDLVLNSFKNNYFIEEIVCKRTINSKKPSSKTKEVLIKNY